MTKGKWLLETAEAEQELFDKSLISCVASKKPGNKFHVRVLWSLVTKQEADSKWREKRIYELVVFLEKNKDVMQTLDVYKKEEGKIWQRKPSPSPEEGWDFLDVMFITLESQFANSVYFDYCFDPSQFGSLHQSFHNKCFLVTRKKYPIPSNGVQFNWWSLRSWGPPGKYFCLWFNQK